MINNIGWDAISGDAWIEAYHKLYDDGPDVIVAINRLAAGFEVRSSAESRTSGPADTIVGTFATIEDAREAVKKDCEEWDNYIANLT